MKITKSILTTAVLAAISGSVFAAETTLPSNVYSNVDGMTTVGNNNRVIDTTLSNQSTVVGANNIIKRATENTTIIGANIAIDGKNNVALGAHNDIAGHDSVVVGFHSGAAAYKELADDEMPDLTVNPAAEGVGATIIGSHSKVYNQLSTAIGYNTQASGENNIALGAYSAVGNNVHAADTKYAGVSNNKGVLSIGAFDRAVNLIYDGMPTAVEQPWQDDFTRQIQRVSAGEVSATSTDAINGSQLQDAFDRSAVNATNIATNAANIIKAKTTVSAGSGVSVKESTNDNGSTNYEVSVAKSLTDQVEANRNGIDGLSGRIGKNADAIQANADKIRDLQVDVVSNRATVTGKGIIRVRTSVNDLGSNGITYEVSANENAISDIAKASNRFAGDTVVKVERQNNPSGVADVTTIKFDANEASKVLPITYKANGENTQTTTAANGFNFVNGNHITSSVDANGVVKFDLDKTVTDAIDTNAKAIKGNTVAIGDNTTAINNLKTEVVKAKSTVSAGNGVVVNNTTNADGSTNYQVTVDKAVTDKVDANTKGIKDNADAIKANKDNIAINKATIDELAAHIDNGGNNMNALNSKINDVQKESRHGIAGASALAAMHPLDYDPEHKMDVMAGVGHFKGSTAVAIGTAYRPNENLMFTVGASLNGSDSTINAGVTYKVGTDAKDTYHSKASMMNKIKQLETTVEEQNAQIEKLMKIVDALVPANTQA